MTNPDDAVRLAAEKILRECLGYTNQQVAANIECPLRILRHHLADALEDTRLLNSGVITVDSFGHPPLETTFRGVPLREWIRKGIGRAALDQPEREDGDAIAR